MKHNILFLKDELKELVEKEHSRLDKESQENIKCESSNNNPSSQGIKTTTK